MTSRLVSHRSVDQRNFVVFQEAVRAGRFAGVQGFEDSGRIRATISTTSSRVLGRSSISTARTKSDSRQLGRLLGPQVHQPEHPVSGEGAPVVVPIRKPTQGLTVSTRTAFAIPTARSSRRPIPSRTSPARTSRPDQTSSVTRPRRVSSSRTHAGHRPGSHRRSARRQ